MNRIAITGGIAEGKSTVLAHLAELGYSTLSSDEIVRDLYRDPEIRQEVSRIAGLPSEAPSEALRDLIADDVQVRRKINRFIHPLVVSKLILSEALFHEVPLLYEVNLQKMYRGVWVVTCGIEIQKTRLRLRYGENVDSNRLLSTQLDSRIKKAHADYEIRTDLPFISVYHQLEIALGQFGLD